MMLLGYCICSLYFLAVVKKSVIYLLLSFVHKDHNILSHLLINYRYAYFLKGNFKNCTTSDIDGCVIYVKSIVKL